MVEIALEPLSENKPSNRGKFSPDRAYWEELHQRRYLQWQLSTSIEAIAAEEGVTYKRSETVLRQYSSSAHSLGTERNRGIQSGLAFVLRRGF